MVDLNLEGTSVFLQEESCGKIISGKDEEIRSTHSKTFVIFGVPRGGTTMVARVVENLGVNLGSNLPANYEDNDFNFDLLPKDLKKNQPVLTERLLDVVDRRNQDLDVWGWKYPRAPIYLTGLLRKLRNPHLICVMRDPVASGIRNMRRAQKSLKKTGSASDNELSSIPSKIITQHLQLQLKNIQTIQQIGCPSFLCSYEKAILKTDVFVREMADFLDISSTENQIKNAIHQIQPGGYMQVSAE